MIFDICLRRLANARMLSVVAALLAPGISSAQTASVIQGNLLRCPSGTPLTGYRVYLWANPERPMMNVRTAYTNASGQYIFNVVAPGAYRVAVTYSDVHDGSDVVVAPGETAIADLRAP